MKLPLIDHLRPTGALLCAALLGLTASCAPGTESEIAADFVALDKAIRSYASTNGRYPEDLDELSRPDKTGRIWLDDAAHLVDPFGRPYAYEPSRGSQPHNLVSLGPDGQRDEGDLDLRKWRARRM